MKWISITDRLPPEDTEVLIYNPNDSYWSNYTDYFVGCYVDGGWYGGYNSFTLTGVTHWAELTSPIKQQED